MGEIERILAIAFGVILLLGLLAGGVVGALSYWLNLTTPLQSLIVGTETAVITSIVIAKTR